MSEKLKETQLDRIERKIDENNKASNIRWTEALGLGLIVASAGLVPQALPVAVSLYVVGLLVMVSPNLFKKKY